MTPLESLTALQEQIKLTANHRYYIAGKPVPNVSTIIKQLDAPQLDAWKVKVQSEGTARAAFHNQPIENEPVEAYVERMKRLAAQEFEHERLSKEAADDGHEVHALIEWRMRKALGQELPRPKVSEEAAFREAGWMKWANGIGLKPVAVESRVANKALRYCGTIDLLAEVEGVVSLLDWKRAPRVYESHHLQSIGYRMALESLGFAPMPGYVLLMPPGQDPELAPCSDTDTTREAFMACVTLYNWTRELAKMREAA